MGAGGVRSIISDAETLPRMDKMLSPITNEVPRLDTRGRFFQLENEISDILPPLPITMAVAFVLGKNHNNITCYLANICIFRVFNQRFCVFIGIVTNRRKEKY